MFVNLLQAQIQLKAAAKLAGKDLSSKKHKKDKKHKKEKKDKEKLKSKRKHRDYGCATDHLIQCANQELNSVLGRSQYVLFHTHVPDLRSRCSLG